MTSYDEDVLVSDSGSVVHSVVGLGIAWFGGHDCPRLKQGDTWCAVVSCGVQQRVDLGRGRQQADLADPAARTARLIPEPNPSHHDDASSAP
jgi:hypothetical protein